MDEKFKIKYIYYNRFAHFGYDLYRKLNSSFPFNSIPINQNEDFNPFFIVGSGRSGNTLLRSILNSHTNIIIPPETYVFGKLIRLHTTHKNISWHEYVALMLSTIEYHQEFYTFEIDSLNKLALKLRRVTKKKRSLAYIINAFYDFYAKKKNLHMKRWGDKTPLNSMYVYRIKKIFPDAQFIHLIRDGVDVASSYVEAGLYKDYSIAALSWEKSIQFLRKFGNQNSSNYLEIKYENLVENPESVVSTICFFLDIKFKKEMLIQKRVVKNLGDVEYLDHHKNVYNDINTDSIGKGRDKIPHQNLRNISLIINNTLEDLGYKKIIL